MQTRSMPLHRRALVRWTKRGLLAVAVVVACGLVVVSLLPKPIPVDMAEVTRGPLTVTLTEDGRARVKDRYRVSAPIGGRVTRTTWEPGQDVKAGDALAQIVPNLAPLLDPRSKTLAQARVAAAKATRKQVAAQVDRADAAVEFARAEAARVRRLAAGQITTQRELEEARMAERTALAQLNATRLAQRVAQHELQMARAALHPGRNGSVESFAVTAPIDGRVLAVHQKSEGVVQPGAPLMTIGDPTALEIVVDVLTRDAVKIRPGADARIERWGGDPVTAVVRRVEPSAFTRLSALGVEEQRVNVILDLTVPPAQWSGLNDGYRVEARITLWRGESVVTVPTSAVFRRDGAWTVYRVRDDVVETAAVEIGHRTGRRVEVLSGVEPGDTVVLHPSDRIQHGAAVAPRSEARADEAD